MSAKSKMGGVLVGRNGDLVFRTLSNGDVSGLLPHLPQTSIDPFTKKDWYEVKAPVTFQTRSIGQTLVTRTQGKSKESDIEDKLYDLWLCILQSWLVMV